MMDLLTLIAEIGSEEPKGQKYYFRFMQMVLQALIGVGIIKFAKQDRALTYFMFSVMFLWVNETGIYSGFRGVALSFIAQLFIAVALVQFFKSRPRPVVENGPGVEAEGVSLANERS